MTNQPKIVCLSGKMGAGKTSYAIKESSKPYTILLSEDEFLSSLYLGKISSIEDYSHYARAIKPMVKDLVKQLVEKGNSVVMDFPANTFKQRKWLKQLIDICQVNHELVYLNVSDDVCLKHLEKRRKETPERSKFDNPDFFFQMTKYFEEPTKEEGFNLRILNIDK